MKCHLCQALVFVMTVTSGWHHSERVRNLAHSLTHCGCGLWRGKVGAVPDAEDIGVFLVLKSFFINVHPASSISHRTCLEDIWRTHGWCYMKHFILQRKTSTWVFFPVICPASKVVPQPPLSRHWTVHYLLHVCTNPHLLQGLKCSQAASW